jgi:AraC-like DNA-binding protein
VPESASVNPAGPASARRGARHWRTSLAAAYPRLLVDIASDAGIDPVRVLAGTPLTLAQLLEPETRVPSATAARMVRNALALTGNPALGYELGLRMRVTSHGFLGYAAMSSPTLGDALMLLLRYADVRARDVGFALFEEGERTLLRFSEHHDLGGLRRFYYESLMIGQARMAGRLLGEAMLDCELWCEWAEPDYHAAYRERLPPMRFGMPMNQVAMPTALLRRPLADADPVAARLAMAQVRRELALSLRAPENLAERVRAELTLAADGYPDLPAVATRLFLSPRTLKRRLAAVGTSYFELLEQARYRDACRLLDNADLSLQQIAYALGYADPPSFTRAFRRWSGQAPSAFRIRSDAGSRDRPALPRR